MRKPLFLKKSEKNPFFSTVTYFAFWLFAVLYLESLLHIVVYGGFTWKFLYTLGFSAAFAGVLTLIGSFLPKKAGFPVAVVLLVVLMVLYGSQLVYKFIFGTLYSVAQIQQGGAAITSFWKETVATIKERFAYILLLFLPLVVLILIRIFVKKALGASNWLWRGITAAVSIVACVVTILCLNIGGTGYFTDYYFYHSNETTTTQAAERFGLLTALRLELFTGEAETTVADDGYFSFESTETTTSPTESTGVVETEPGETEPTDPGFNVINIDFAALNEMTEDETILAINNYCAGLTGTNRNEYTGMLHDYNLIVLCAESFSPAAIHPEVTPTLYKLANEGIIFNNFYTTFPNNTTDGEYSICMGLFPDSSRTKLAPSFYASKDSYLPYCLGNAFSEQAEIQCYGYHNYEGQFYGRDETHPNLGYAMKFAGDGMTFTTDWPASDLEMMEQSIDDYLSSDTQFHAYYMTFSGHFKYDRSVNPMANRNWSAVSGLSYGNTAKAYLACNVELDKAMEYLLRRLEEAGVADKTAIVIAADHYPYGLENYQYSQLMGYDIDDFTKYRSSLIFWVGGLEENIVVDEYCCNVDILPTILNLWGFEYDSRMLAGTDVFSDGTHVAILSDKSFFTDKVWFNASTGKVKYLVDESELPENYVENMIKLVNTKFTLSVNILESAYYNFVFEMGSVAVSREGWTTWAEWVDMTGAIVEEPKEEEPEPEPEPETTAPTQPDTPDAGGEVTEPGGDPGGAGDGGESGNTGSTEGGDTGGTDTGDSGSADSGSTGDTDAGNTGGADSGSTGDSGAGSADSGAGSADSGGTDAGTGSSGGEE